MYGNTIASSMIAFNGLATVQPSCKVIIHTNPKLFLLQDLTKAMPAVTVARFLWRTGQLLIQMPRGHFLVGLPEAATSCKIVILRLHMFVTCSGFAAIVTVAEWIYS